MLLASCVLFACAALAGAQQPATQPLCDFADLSAWTLHPDGGRKSVVAADPTAASGHGMRIRYEDGPPHWSNLAAACTVPRNASAIRFELTKHSSAGNAAMHLILVEPDGDMWMQQVLVGGKSIGGLAPGRHTVRSYISRMGFDPRGNRRREMTKATKLLIGCNYGDLDVTVDNMVWEVTGHVNPQPLPSLVEFRPEVGQRGNIAILDLGSEVPTGHPPAKLQAALREAGYGVTLLPIGDFGYPKHLTPELFDAVVLPYGPVFPVYAHTALIDYLKAGGSLLATDGYAFDKPVRLAGRSWVDSDDVITAEQMDLGITGSVRMNTRYGEPGDAMSFAPEQIGVFDPAFTLEGISSAKTTGIYAGNAVRYSFAKSPEGFAAVALLGDNSPVFPPVYRRWTPVIEASDPSGGGRGALLSLVTNHAGVYKGSAWAISGVTSGEDLLLGTPARRKLLARVMDRLVDRVFLHGLRTDKACYRAGDTVRVNLTVTNFGRRPFKGSIAVTIGGKPAKTVDVSLAPGASEEVTISAKADAKADYVPVAATLRRGTDGLDRAETAYCVWSPAIVAKGPKAAWKDNRLTLDGSSAFLVGTNQTGMMFYSEAETPATWERDFRLMAAHKVRILRILHFSPFAKDGYKGSAANAPLDLANRPERLQAQVDAIVQLAAKHGIVIFLTLHDWIGLALTNEELAAQADWNRFWAARYKDAPNVIFDVQNEPSVDVPDRPDVVALWNAWLEHKYGTTDAIVKAWGTNAPTANLPNIPIPQMGDDWHDVRSADRKRFEAELLNRWVKANVDGVKGGNENAVVTVGYLPSMPPADKLLGNRETDFSNMHFYGSLRDMPLELKLVDRRAYGKGFSLGEFGSEEAHHARTRGETGMPVADSVRRFSQVVHYAVGLGASFVCNWDWKEFDEMVFPWGLVQRGSSTPKPWLNTYAQEAAFLSRFPLSQETPQLSLFVPDTHRIGPRFDEIHGALRRAISLLLDENVCFDIVNEEDPIDTSAKAILAPIPYCLGDRAPDLLEWAKNGGALYVSGDLAFDGARKPTRMERQVAYGLPASPAVSPFEAFDALWTREPSEVQVGKGKVLCVPYPLELRPRSGDAEVYRRFLAMAGIQPTPVEAGGKPVRAMETPLVEDGRVYTLVRTDDGEELVPVTLPEISTTVELRGGGCAFVVANDRGEVIAAESQGAITVRGTKIASAAGHFGIVAEDREPVDRSERLLVLPHLNQSVTLVRQPGDPAWSWRIFRMDDAMKSSAATGETAKFVPGQVAIVTPAKSGK